MLFWFVGIISTVLVVFSFLLYILLEDGIHGEIELQMQNKANFIQKNMIENINNEKIKFYLELVNSQFIILKNQEVVYASVDFPLENIELYQESENMFFVYETDKHTEDAVLRSKFTTPYEGEIILHLEAINDKAEKIQDILIYLNPLLLLFLILIGNNIIDKILIPIKKLTDRIEKINISAMPNKIITENKNNEITQLENAFNEMVERLQNGIETLNNFNNDVSHELKTPLTVVNAAIELCLRKKRESLYYEDSLQTIQYEIKQIEKIIDELFLFSKYSKDTISSTFKECYVDSILLDVISKYEQQALDKEIMIDIKKMDNIKMEVNPLLINIIFSNLLDNAIKYSTYGKKITIDLSSENNRNYFRIVDEGIGIRDDLIPKITDKFYRVDESRNKNIKGFGLGLSIVKNFVALHNAELDIQSQVDKGTIITIYFEKKQKS